MIARTRLSSKSVKINETCYGTDLEICPRFRRYSEMSVHSLYHVSSEKFMPELRDYRPYEKQVSETYQTAEEQKDLKHSKS